jgi:hypothetical protein
VTKAADALADAIETILVDCYNEDEQYTAFLTVLDDQLHLPAPATPQHGRSRMHGPRWTGPARIRSRKVLRFDANPAVHVDHLVDDLDRWVLAPPIGLGVFVGVPLVDQDDAGVEQGSRRRLEPGLHLVVGTGLVGYAPGVVRLDGSRGLFGRVAEPGGKV